MNKFIIASLFILLAMSCTSTRNTSENSSPTSDAPVVIVVHGGAGTIKRKHMTPEKEAAYKAAIEEALAAGYDILNQGGSSLDAVQAAVMVLEDCPLFNAGRGSVYNHDGVQEMDAALMDGRTQNSGAVAGVNSIKNPIEAARLVLDSSRHVLLSGQGAERYALTNGLAFADSGYFYNERRWNQLQRAIEKEKVMLDHDGAQGYYAPLEELWGEHKKYGTVGAVALDKDGNLAAATSTGGLTNKRFGRIGDSPLVGAGTFANTNCAVSCTGHGEYFIRNVVAYDVAAMMSYAQLPLDSAARTVIHHKLKPQGGKGGLIAVDKDGNVSMTFNTRGMYRGVQRKAGSPVVLIYADE